MQNKRFLQLTIAAVLISISCFLYVKCNINQIVVNNPNIELKSEQTTDNDRIGLGFFDIEFAQKVGSTFRFLRTLKS